MKIFRFDKGNAVVRKYKAVKVRRNIIASFAAVDFAFAASDAKHKFLSGAIINGGLCCLMARLCADLHSLVKYLEPQYKNVVQRAKKIYRNK